MLRTFLANDFCLKTKIDIRYQHSVCFRLFNVSLDIAIPSPAGDRSMAHGIEVCDCPPEYNSTSCQNPRIGYYRWYKRDYITSTVIIDLVGEARPCQCNGRSNMCDTETGFCQV